MDRQQSASLQVAKLATSTMPQCNCPITAQGPTPCTWRTASISRKPGAYAALCINVSLHPSSIRARLIISLFSPSLTIDLSNTLLHISLHWTAATAMADILTYNDSGHWSSFFPINGSQSSMKSHQNLGKSHQSLHNALETYIPIRKQSYGVTGSEASKHAQISQQHSHTIQYNSKTLFSTYFEPHPAKKAHSERRDRSNAANRMTNKFQCYICQRTFSQLKTLKRHFDTVHRDGLTVGKTIKHRCSVCHEFFSRKDVLLRHEHEQHRAGRVQCMLCGTLVMERWLRGHLTSQICKARRVCEDSRLVKIFESSLTTFIMEPILDPLFATSQLYCMFSFIEDRDITTRLQCCVPTSLPKRRIDLREGLSAAYLRLRYMTIRTILRALGDPVQVCNRRTTGALLTMSLLDNAVGFCENSLLYCDVLRIMWSSERYQMDSPKIRAIMQSAFEAAHMPKESTSIVDDNVSIPLSRVDHFGDALMNRPRPLGESMRAIRASIAGSA